MPKEEYSKVGEIHRKARAENQDVILIRKNSQFCFYALADGVSSRSFSKEGAQIACETAAELFMRPDRLLLNYEKNKAVCLLLSEILYNIKNSDTKKSTDIKEYASTLMFALVDKKTQLVYLMNLGDGICLATLEEKIFELSCTDEQAHGCYVTTTENVADYVFFDEFDAYKYDSFVLMSDGAWRRIYEKGKIKEHYKNMIINKDVKNLQIAFDTAVIDDDCSFVFVDLAGMRAKGL